MSFLDYKFNFRIREDIYNEIERIARRNHKYDSVGHFIRVAINEKIREENPQFFDKVNNEIIKGGQK